MLKRHAKAYRCDWLDLGSSLESWSFLWSVFDVVKTKVKSVLNKKNRSAVKIGDWWLWDKVRKYCDNKVTERKQYNIEQEGNKQIERKERKRIKNEKFYDPMLNDRKEQTLNSMRWRVQKSDFSRGIVNNSSNIIRRKSEYDIGWWLLYDLFWSFDIPTLVSGTRNLALVILSLYWLHSGLQYIWDNIGWVSGEDAKKMVEMLNNTTQGGYLDSKEKYVLVDSLPHIDDEHNEGVNFLKTLSGMNPLNALNDKLSKMWRALDPRLSDKNKWDVSIYVKAGWYGI